jgi:uncharacterized repeat protein (TIGR02543 family)
MQAWAMTFVTRTISALRAIFLPVGLARVALWLGVGLLLSVPAMAQAPVVSNVVAQQRPGTGLVDITYDVYAEHALVKISLQISNDDGVSFQIPVETYQGDIGDSISIGTNKKITWDAKKDWPAKIEQSLLFQISVDDLNVSGFSYVRSGFLPADSWDGSQFVDAFFMAKNETTKSEYKRVLEWSFNRYDIGGSGGDPAWSDIPISSGYDWFTAVKWCNARSEMEGLIPVYKIGSNVYRTGSNSPTIDANANGYRLPSEKEWEFSARGGRDSKNYIYSGSNNVEEVAWYSYNSQNTIKSVGLKLPNELGIFDMSGNVSEWCFDIYNNTSFRVARGGNIFVNNLNLSSLQNNTRGYGDPYVSYSSSAGGFRVARTHAEGAKHSATKISGKIDTRNWNMDLYSSSLGSISGGGTYISTSTASLSATPFLGYLFDSWTGDMTGLVNPAEILMDSDKTVGAIFVEDARDPDNDGLTNYQEIIVRLTNPNVSDTDSDGINDGAEVQQGRSPKVAEAVITNLVVTQRTGTKFFDISYDIASTTPTVKMSLEISSDGGATYTVPVTSATGAIGEGVAVGNGKSIVWNAGVDWDGKSSSQMRFRLIADNQIIDGLSLIPAGSFTMGRTSGDTDTDAPPVTVNVSQFYMGKYEVTKSLWDEVRTWALANGYTDLAAGAGKAANHPVQTVSWWDVIKWCNARSQKEGLTPCYTVNGSVIRETQISSPTCNFAANGYRLPTEAEWEKAARGGVSGKRFPWGDDIISHNHANFNNNGSEAYKSGTLGLHPDYLFTSPVGSFTSNNYDLYDMAGNVWEWCFDAYRDSYENNTTDPVGRFGDYRIYRGGSWGNDAYSARIANRDRDSPSNNRTDKGFRFARSRGSGAVAKFTSTEVPLDTRSWILIKSPQINGNINAAESYLSQTNATVTATPLPGYIFGSWNGDASGTQNPLTITMDTDKTVGATFDKDLSDADNDGLTAFDELVTYSTNPNLADTDGDGINDGAEVQQGRSPSVSEPVITNLVATQRTGTKFFDISYDLSSTTSTVKMSLEISSDGGVTYTVPVSSATGAIGESVAVGNGKSIVWNAGVDWDAKFSSQMRFRLIADNLELPGFSYVAQGALPSSSWAGAQNVDAFYMAKTEVTWAEFQTVRAWAATNGYDIGSAGAGTGPNRPVTNVNWYQTLKWCNARSEMEGFRPVYMVGSTIYRNSNAVPTIDSAANGYRLPREKEWEFTARGGVKPNGYLYSGSNDINKTAWYSENSGNEPKDVATKQPNELGVFDMSGNVAEWCFDLFTGSDRVIRGGSWFSDYFYCNYSERYSQGEALANDSYGFRVVRSSILLANAGLATTGNSVLDTRDWTIAVTTPVNGITIGAGPYLYNTSATITATPNLGYRFTGWTGDASGTQNPLTILMDADKTVGATFVEDTRDPDNDGLTNYQEIILRLTNPDVADTDSDGVNDGQEVADTTNPLVADTDADGLTDGEEKSRTTNPLLVDTDSDGLSDYQEIIIRLTNPNLADSDNDGVEDGQEVTDTTNPLIADTDGDGLSDGEEKSRSTNPLVTDTDGDSYSDSYEVNNDADPKTNTSFPTYTLTLANNGASIGGTFANSGTLAHGTNATLTATPSAGYLFGSWNGASSGSNNPTTVLMNSNKTVGANFVEDTRDPDNDGLTNYQEIIIRLTNPNLADTDNDGVNDGQEVTDTTNPLVADTDGDGITDGEEKTRTTNPLVVDTDGDGLGDLQEITISQTNPLLSDTNGNGVNDALEDSDNDGILNGREVNQLDSNPLLADTNANGLSDTYELLFQGNTDPFTPRVGDRVRYDLSQLGYQGTYKVVGTLPKGLTFNATTGILEGKLIGTAGTSKLTIQILNGKTVLRSIPLNIPVLAFPATLVGTWQTLLENQQDQPEGLLTVTITSPGTWSASYDGIGTRTIRKAKGSFDLTAAEEEASWSMTFPAVFALPSGLPAVTMSFDIFGSTALAEGTHPRGMMRGFRLARGAELPAKTNTITMLIDQGAQDGFLIPAGMGWATGSISNRGAVSLKGQLGDAQAITTTLSLGATGQALMWLKPYKNLNSFIGGIVSLHGSGVLPASPLHNQESELWWYRAADAAELGYSTGFAPISPFVGVRSHLLPTSALALSQNLGLTEQVIRGVAFDGGGLPDPNAVAKLPEAFAIDASYKMIAVPIPGQPMTPWTGLIASRTGGFTGTLKVVASNSDTIAGNAAVSGVLFPTVGSRVVGAGLVKIPIVGPKGAFRTGAILLGTEEQN